MKFWTKKRIIGYIYCENKFRDDEKLFIKLARKKHVKLVMFNIAKELDEKEIEKKAKKCEIIFNNSAEEFAWEFVKTLEQLGKKVIDSSKTYYFTEDKWIFALACKEHDIPTPETILLSENLNIAKRELHEFNHWPVVLKRIQGTCGEYVARAENIEQAEEIINKFWQKGSERLAIIAQEFISSPCYRVTIVGDEIVQTAIKNGRSWKKTGIYAKNIERFEIDPHLKAMIDKIIKVSKIHICGIDFVKKGDEWLVLEVNSTPAFDFFDEEREMIIGKVLNLLLREIQ
ncbi:ATP-grasp domain-containing protein [Candidatus Pacearchaeota archaeon]|nr:ATP-grasp domain-containing protein [Candidatus Pacearchaeota archaeon]